MKSMLFVAFCFAFAVSCSATTDSERQANAKLVLELYEAIGHGDLSAVQSIIGRGVQLTYAENEKPPGYPVHHAISEHNRGNFNEEILKLLIKSGANLEDVDYMDRTALYQAVDFNNAKAVKILLENGANPNTYNKKLKNSALGAAFLYSSSVLSGEEIIDLLIQNGADVNQTDSRGQTPLHEAVIGGHKKAIELLVEKGANVNVADMDMNMTPLHYLVTLDSTTRGHEHWTEDDQLKYTELLVNHGADVHAKAHVQDKDVTPLDLATSKKVRKFLGSKMGFTGWIRTIW